MHKVITLSIYCIKRKREKKEYSISECINRLSTPRQFYHEVIFDPREHNKQSPQACSFIKKETLAQMFFCKFCEIFKNTFFIGHLW